VQQHDLLQRIDQLEAKVQELAHRLDEDQRRARAQRQRERWIRLGILVLLLAAYLIYARFVISIPT
jgi:cell division septum initiation protein DivIVA